MVRVKFKNSGSFAGFFVYKNTNAKSLLFLATFTNTKKSDDKVDDFPAKKNLFYLLGN
jgi:hypothetical protein